ncbi:MAG: chemotaxis protein CheD [Candidatus Marinimicrobia bacterium]|nr:chemotaxis protein CheD [Candidatus Neomarinimicrobiota bacterium]
MLTVGISDLVVSDKSDDILITYSLGSCIGVTMYDPVARVGALIHCMLPLSKMYPEKSQNKPYMFVDTGIIKMLQAVYDKGAEPDRLIVKVAGGASLLDPKRMFRIGERNYAVTRKILWKNNLMIAADDVGGSKSRTLMLYMDTGRTTIKNKGEELEL